MHYSHKYIQKLKILIYINTYFLHTTYNCLFSIKVNTIILFYHKIHDIINVKNEIE